MITRKRYIRTSHWSAKILFAALFILEVSCIRAQDLEVTVNVSAQGLPGSNKDALVNFKSDLENYFNTYRWTTDDTLRKVSAQINVFFSAAISDNVYQAQITVSSSRELKGSTKRSPLVRIKDDKWEFTYARGQSFFHDFYTYNSLTSMLDFYANLLLAVDRDSRSPLGGTPYYGVALTIASRGSAASGAGWVESLRDNYNRYALVNEALSASTQPMRRALAQYHTALEVLQRDNDSGKILLSEAVTRLADAKEKAQKNRSAFLTQLLDAKSGEFAELAATCNNDTRSAFIRIDPVRRNLYESK